MAKIGILAMGITLLLGSMALQSFAGEQAATTLGKPASLSALMGVFVSNPKGEPLGRVTDFVIDPQGHVTFVVLAHGGFLGFGEREVAVPFNLFAFDRQRRHFVLDLTKEKLDGAPMFAARDLYSEKWAEQDYRYFGEAPYWTEGELVEKGIKPPAEPWKLRDDAFPYYYMP